MLLALQWSSLSNPTLVIDAIKERYNVELAIARRTRFGSYTGRPEVFRHLLEQREKGVAVFSSDGDGLEHACFLFLSTVLRRQ
jgi:hypothetical protein